MPPRGTGGGRRDGPSRVLRCATRRGRHWSAGAMRRAPCARLIPFLTPPPGWRVLEGVGNGARRLGTGSLVRCCAARSRGLIADGLPAPRTCSAPRRAPSSGINHHASRRGEMTDSKPWYTSRSIIGAPVTIGQHRRPVRHGGRARAGLVLDGISRATHRGRRRNPVADRPAQGSAAHRLTGLDIGGGARLEGRRSPRLHGPETVGRPAIQGGFRLFGLDTFP